MKTKSKFLVTASEWFESLSEKNQKAYIAMHPDSKFAHKVGTGQKNPAITKSKNKQMEHLEQEGVDVGKDYFGHGSNDAGKIGSVADLSGKKSARGASAPRALLEDLGTHKSKLVQLRALRDKYKDQLDNMDIGDKNYPKVQDKLDKVRDQLSVLINK